MIILCAKIVSRNLCEPKQCPETYQCPEIFRNHL